jgi:hypothetical protein
MGVTMAKFERKFAGCRLTKNKEIVDAHRLGDDGWPDEIWDGVNNRQIILHLGRSNGKTVGHVEIKTELEPIVAKVGDWIVRGIRGEFYACSSEVFSAGYVPA